MSSLQADLCTGWHCSIAWFLLKHDADVHYCAEKAACDEAHPVLFDAVCTAIWNARRYYLLTLMLQIQLSTTSHSKPDKIVVILFHI